MSVCRNWDLSEMRKLIGSIHWPSFTTAMVISSFGGLAAYSWSNLGFWTGFGITAAAMLINGWLATVEDERSGGFYNPVTEEENSDSDS
jgi:hypothetical protein